MTRTEFIQRLVLDAICDDFENIDQVILKDVSSTGAKCGLTILRPEIAQGLRALVGAGLAKAYDLRSVRDPFACELQEMPSLDVPEEPFRIYFHATRKGLELHASDDSWWPLDDDGALRSNWIPPAD
jgi:hypothetical protein